MGIGSVVAAEGSDTTRRILAAASEEFARRGYASARVREIVDAARVNVAAVNYHFGGKAGLYAATLRHLAARQRPGTRERRGQSPAERLHREVYAMLERFVGAKCASPLSRILAHEAMNPTPHHEQLIEEMVRPELEVFRAIVRELAGEAASEAQVASAAVGVMGHCLVYLSARGSIDRLHPELTGGHGACKTLARHITDFSLAGIACLASRGHIQ
jgi:TetR/AcrR family transcriptional regulator, regulator of cefoperazone and chloramphenicol sensitivity